MKRGVLLLAFLLLVALVPGRAANPPGAPDDHFLSYRAKIAKGQPSFIRISALRLIDAFEDQLFDLVAPAQLLVPVNKDDEGIVDPATHLLAYRLKATKLCSDDGEPCDDNSDCSLDARCKSGPKHARQFGVRVTDQLGTLELDTIKADLLLVPAAKDLIGSPLPPDPGSHEVDHYKCYKVRVTPQTLKFAKGRQVRLTDQLTFPPKVFELLKPQHLCLPVDKRGEGIMRLEGWLTCYSARQTKGECVATAPENALGGCRREEDCGGDSRLTSFCVKQPKHEKRPAVFVNDQLGPLTLSTIKEGALCVPAVGPAAPSPTTSGTPSLTATPSVSPTPSVGPVPSPTLTAPGDRPPSVIAPAAVIAPLGDAITILAMGSDPDCPTPADDCDPSDPERDGLALHAAPVPLPRNATFNQLTGMFTFRPDAMQVGTFLLTFSASDSSLTASKTVEITVPEPPGTTTLRGLVLTAASDPLPGVRLVLGTAAPVETMSGGDGTFLFPNVPVAGRQRLLIDGQAVGPQFATVPEIITIIPGADNVLDAPIFLLPLDVASGDPIDPNAQSLITSSPVIVKGLTFPPVTLVVPPGTARLEDTGALYGGNVHISAIPAPELGPRPLPDDLTLSVYIAVQPFGVMYDPPVAVIFPNPDGFPVGAVVDIFGLNHDTGAMEKVGEGQVQADGMIHSGRFDPTTGTFTPGGVVRNNSWHGFTPAPPEAVTSKTSEADGPQPCGGGIGGSEACLKSGNATIEHDLVSYRSFGVSRSLRFQYDSSTAAPRPLLSALGTPGNLTPPPETVSTELTVAGLGEGTETFLEPPGFCTSVICPFGVLSRIFDASALPTGVYPATLSINCNFPVARRVGRQSQNLVVVNQRQSPFGLGWSLKDLQQLHRAATGDLVLTDGDASALVFTPAMRARTEIRRGGERDLYHFAANAGDFVTIRMNRRSSLPDGTATLDPGIELRDSRGFLLAHDDDGGSVVPGGPGANALISTFQLSATDTYSIDARGEGGTSGPYDLLLTSATDTQFTGGRINPPIPIEPSFAFEGVISAVPQPAAPTFVFPGTISALAEKDTFTFPANAGTIATIQANRVASNPDGSGSLDPVVELRDSRGFLLAQDDNIGTNVPPGPGRNALILNRELPATDTYTVSVHGADGTIGPYEVRVTFGALTVQTESDTFAFTANAGTAAFVAVDRIANNPDGTASLDPLVELRDSRGFLVARDDNTGTNLPPGPGRNALIPRFTLAATDQYSLTVRGANETVGPYDVVVTFGDLPAGLDFDDSGAVTVEPAVASPPGEFSTLRINADDSLTRTLKDGTRIELDATGRQTAFVDRNGNATGYGYDAGARLTSITDPAGLQTVLRYAAGLLSEVEDPAGRITRFEHGSQGRLTRITDPDGAVTEYDYDSQGLLTSKTSPRQHVTFYDYDPFSARFLRSRLPDGSMRIVENSQAVGLVDPSGGSGTVANPAPQTPASAVISRTIDGNGHATTVDTDALGNAALVRDPLNRETTITRDPNGLPTRVQRPNGSVVANTFDDRGNLTSTTEEAIGATTRFTYEPVFNQATSITDPLANPTSIDYDAAGNPSGVTDAMGTRTALAYADASCPGQLTSVTSAVALPEETTTAFVYDPATCNLATTLDPLQNPTKLRYDAAGNVIQSCDALGRVTRFRYDAMNRLVKVIDATTTPPDLGCALLPPAADPPCPVPPPAPDPDCAAIGTGVDGVTCYEYDPSGNLSLVVDARGSPTGFEYDALSRLAASIDPCGAAETFTYDPTGNLRTSVDRSGQTIDLGYDTADQLVHKTLLLGTPTATVTTYSYDALGNLTSAVDPDSSLSMTYDATGRLASVTTAGSQSQPAVTLQYTYNTNGNRVTMTDHVGITTYVYDLLNRLVDLTDPSSLRHTFEYDSLSRRTALRRPNGVNTTYTYDSASQLRTLVHQLTGAVEPISLLTYAYDPAGNRLHALQERSTLSVQPQLDYVYDVLDRLIEATHPVPTESLETFVYDAAGNRLLRDGQSAPAVIDAANRLLEDEDFCYEYDANGRLYRKTEKHLAICAGNVTTFSYDAEDRLVQVELAAGTLVQYRYDGLGRRIAKSFDDQVIARYVYDDAEIALEFDAASQLHTRYTRGPSIDEALILSHSRQDAGMPVLEDHTFYAADALGSVIELFDADALVVASYLYDSFGITTVAGTSANEIAFSGRELDPETGLYFFRNRYYDPSIGRFISEDPIGGSSYAYAGNNPIVFVDPIGLAELEARRGSSNLRFDSGRWQFDWATAGRGSASVGPLRLDGYGGATMPITTRRDPFGTAVHGGGAAVLGEISAPVVGKVGRFVVSLEDISGVARGDPNLLAPAQYKPFLARPDPSAPLSSVGFTGRLRASAVVLGLPVNIDREVTFRSDAGGPRISVGSNLGDLVLNKLLQTLLGKSTNCP